MFKFLALSAMIAIFVTQVFSAVSANAQALDFDQLGLEDIYQLPEPQLEQFILGRDGETCAGLVSSYKPGKDPAGLTPAQFCAVQNYSNAGYLVNGPLWRTDANGAALTGSEWAYVRVLDAALAKIKSEPPQIVYRGTAAYQLKFTKPGQIVRLKGYTSTSSKKEVAEEFIKDRLMVIKAFSGKNITSYSNAGGERELLLPRSTLVRFDRAETVIMELFTDEGPEKRKVEIVYLTEVPRS